MIGRSTFTFITSFRKVDTFERLCIRTIENKQYFEKNSNCVFFLTIDPGPLSPKGKSYLSNKAADRLEYEVLLCTSRNVLEND